MKYNILAVANEEYSEFLKLFVNSFFEFVDAENLAKVYVYDTGLSMDTKNYID